MEKVKIGIAFAILLCIIRVCGYIRSIAKNNFKIRDLVGTGSGEELMWLDNSKYNKYDISFEALNGSDTKEIISKKSTYGMKINTDAISGDVNLKIYNNNKVLFDENGSINKTITIGRNDSINVKVQLTGNKAKGHVIINLS
jgi:hypothetical protein